MATDSKIYTPTETAETIYVLRCGNCGQIYALRWSKKQMWFCMHSTMLFKPSTVVPCPLCKELNVTK